MLKESNNRLFYLEMVQEQYIWYVIFNNWHLDGILYLKYGHRIVYDAASKPEAKVDSVIKEKQWIWNPARSDDLMDVQSKLFLVEFKEEALLYGLLPILGSMFVQQLGRGLELMGMKRNGGDRRLIWFNQNIPRHSFIWWLAIKNKLPTRDRTMCWGPIWDLLVFSAETLLRIRIIISLNGP